MVVIKEEKMSIHILKQYIELCRQFEIRPTLDGANRFKKNSNLINQLSQEDLETVLFDVIALL